MTGIPEWYIRFGNWIFKLLMLNVLWFFGTLLGLIIFGFFPATVALFAVIRKLVMQAEEDAAIFPLFWSTYKAEFVKSNLLGMIVLLIGGLFAFDLYILNHLEPSMLNQLLRIILFVAIIVYSAFVTYIFPVFVHYDTNMIGYLKYTIILVLGRPFHTMFMLTCLVVLLYLLRWIPGLIPVFGLSMFALLIMKIA
ncbi:DUF624 domain-containing protein [Gracilibacillus sp. S3-1-1]|uniref:DUF624 domain-containing protein n=1 Tax=Gracilibacillus pellucidus TaxID=3095368 RepID=A0ACC6M3K2_9BACI|nr:DUF624 domain-containing protein [Gracilibacillus sp. S3-1-1]MDX8045540.1 DUF624 domain-containing protein [Gracilibacillus sp. S3-1-1]